MRVELRIPAPMLSDILHALRRPHEFAAERVGFVFVQCAWMVKSSLILLATHSQEVADHDYIDDPRFGALIGAGAFRTLFEELLKSGGGALHTHIHEHAGRPSPSATDRNESAKFVPDFFHANPARPHGTLILSQDSASGCVWLPGRSRAMPIGAIKVIGRPLQYIGGASATK
jgi:hypothetical protein